MRPELPRAIGPRYRWEESSPWAQRRRSIYVLAKRNMRYPMFDAFDLPDMHNSCPCRDETTTAPQALVQLNSELSHELAGAWAARLCDEHAGKASGLVRDAYLAALGREANDDEVAAAVEFIGAAPEPESVANFCHVLFNTNEFLFVD
jgi:hypothetical protein